MYKRQDAAKIISRINGFTYVQTQFDYMTGEVNVIEEKAYSNGLRAKVKCYGADDVREGVAIMRKEGVDVSITGNSTNPTRFQHPVAGTYKKECMENGHPYFSVASGGGTGRTLHPDNMAAGPASYGMTDTCLLYTSLSDAPRRKRYNRIYHKTDQPPIALAAPRPRHLYFDRSRIRQPVRPYPYSLIIAVL